MAGDLTSGFKRTGTVWLVGVAVAALLAAELAVWLLHPRGLIIDPAAVSEHQFFSSAQLDQIHSFRDIQRWLGIGSLVVELAVLTAIALWRPTPIRRMFAWASRRPLIGAAVIAASISVILAVTSLPLGAWMQQRSLDAGLSTQAWGPWFRDFGVSGAIGVALAALGGFLAMVIIRRLRRRWWVGGFALVAIYAIVFTWLAPVVLAPVFNKFEPIPGGPVRSEVERLGRQAGVEIGEIYRVDASRRSTALNASVDGLGSSKRVVIYDNALNDLSRPELRSLLAHELAHVKHNDVQRGVAWVLLVAPLAVLFIQLASTALARRTGDDPFSPAILAPLALLLTLVTLVLGVPGNQLSRMVEARADSFALELTDDPGTLIALQRRLAITNLSTPRPPALTQLIFGTHPTTMERIGAAVAYRRDTR